MAALIDIHIIGDRGTVGELPCSGEEQQIFTLSARGFDPATFRLLAQDMQALAQLANIATILPILFAISSI